MKDLKFRAWDKVENKMYVVDTIEAMTKNTCYELREGVSYHNRWDDECELMQYTGLHDKNCKEIYEGDILVHEDFQYRKDKVLGIMQWDEKIAGFSQFYPICKFEVIGNIYEHSYLLDKKTEK